MTKIYQATGVALGAMLTILMLTALAAGFASCSGCASTASSLAGSSEREALSRVVASSVLIEVTWFDEADKVHSGRGSGVVVARGKVLTAYHVAHHGAMPVIGVRGTGDSELTLAVVQAFDEKEDLAILDAPGLTSQPAIRIAASDPALYSRVYLVGAPGGRLGTISEGFYAGSSVMETLPDDDKLLDGVPVMRVTGSFLWPGISGGPVANLDGELVGIAQACATIETPAGFPDISIPELGSAIPGRVVRSFLRKHGNLR